jgi:hypothetical protein
MENVICQIVFEYHQKHWNCLLTVRGSASLGCGAYLSGHWAQFRWPAHWEKENFMKDISFLELVPIILAFHIWTPRFINKKILLRIDNQALVAIVNNRTSKSKYIMW